MILLFMNFQVKTGLCKIEYVKYIGNCKDKTGGWL